MSTSGISNTPYTEGAQGPEDVSKSSPTTGPKKGEGASSNTKVRNLDELRKEAPEMWDLMLKSLAQNMITESKRHSERVVQEMKKSSR
jgi:hypothetical protein